MAQSMNALVIFGLILLMQRATATEFKVGGATGWSLISYDYNQWAAKNRFRVGDSLLFVYPSDKDSVLQVNIDDYTNCNTASPIKKFTDGNTSFKFDKSGPYFFISGNKENCLKNERIHVIVMADRNSNHSSSPPPMESESPPPSPAMSSPPSPSPPPPGLEIVPAPAPEGEESPSPPSPPPNAASMVVLSGVASLGAFVGSLFLVL
ncbi:hypothetical protein ACHQM5_003680 [Ranunculus cassubicifolius]